MMCIINILKMILCYLIHCHETFDLSFNQFCSDGGFYWAIDLWVKLTFQWPFLLEYTSCVQIN